MPQAGSDDLNSRVLLDTNIVIALFAGDAGVVAAIRVAAAVFVPTVVLGELYYGARKSARSAENVAKIAAFAASAPVLPSDAATAVVYGELKWALSEVGTPIPENDLWIAALARQHGLTLVTRDAHFDAIPTLERVRW